MLPGLNTIRMPCSSNNPETPLPLQACCNVIEELVHYSILDGVTFEWTRQPAGFPSEALVNTAIDLLAVASLTLRKIEARCELLASNRWETRI